MNLKVNSAHIGMTTVVDAHPRFWCEFVLWLLCANRHMTNPKRVYFIGDIPASLVDFAHRHHCETRFSAPLLAGSPHSNKILPFLDTDGFADQIVTDADVFVTGDISKFFRQDQVRLPPNNHGVPPLETFRQVFRAAGLSDDPEPGTALYAGGGSRETFAGNVSGGVIAIPSALRDFAKAWRDRAAWLCENPDLLGRAVGHIDQISFAVAASETGLAFSHLPAQANAILQLLPEIDSVYALHLTSGHIVKFPDWFDPDGTLRLSEINPRLEPELQGFNQLVKEAMAIIEEIPDLAPFRNNFLSPSYRR